MTVLLNRSVEGLSRHGGGRLGILSPLEAYGDSELGWKYKTCSGKAIVGLNSITEENLCAGAHEFASIHQVTG